MRASLSAEDRFAIQELFARYAWALDTADAAGYAAVFTPDALLGMGENRVRGRREIEDYARQLTGRDTWAGSQHYNGQVIVERAEGDRCWVRSYSTILLRQRDNTAAFKWLGIYRDVCVKVDGEWYFEERLWEAWDPDKTSGEYRLPRPQG